MIKQAAYKENEIPQELDLEQTKKRVIDWFARRNYSELELTEKLTQVTNLTIAEEILEWCHQLKLIMAPEAYSEMVVEKLNRQKKGIERINQQLMKKGLASITADQDSELEKSIAVLNKKIHQILKSKPWSSLQYQEKQNTKAKVFRFLATRGFTSEIITSSFDQWIKNNKDTDYDECD